MSGTLTDSDDGICILTCLTEFIGINKTVNEWVALWIAQKNQIVYGYYTFGMRCFPDIEWEFIAQTMIDGHVIFLQIAGDADRSPERTKFFPYSFRGDAE